MSRCTTWIVVSMLCCAGTVAASDDFEIRYDDARLTVRIHRVPLADVLAEVARETGMTIDGEPLDRREVSKRFDALPLGQALRRIVGRQNFVLSYGADGAPRRLELLGTPLAPAVQKPPARERGMSAIRLLLAQPPVAVPPRTARALGGERLPLPRLFAGLGHADFFVRDECATAIVRSMEANGPLLAAIERLDARQLVAFISSQARGAAADATARLYRAARDPRLKSKLSLVLATMNRTVG